MAKFCAERIHEAVGVEWDQGADEEGWCKRWKDAFLNGFDRVDNDIGAKAIAPEIVGSTAVVVVLSGCQIIASNCGDSRAILCRGNQTIPLTTDHKVLQFLPSQTDLSLDVILHFLYFFFF